MTYELVKKLKDAGFPQGLTEHQYGWVEAHQEFELDDGDMTKGVSVPTLSELIDACGKIDFKLRQTYSAYEDKIFYVIERPGANDMERQDTPEEAVANLWIKLNDPKTTT